ncbi:hypothetical protein AQJ58_22785 [Streptomyces sp. DSM 15324]|nr:hypothetical protein AQJ58_22785 [Streptomyces sp. DSM 15324]
MSRADTALVVSGVGGRAVPVGRPPYGGEPAHWRGQVRPEQPAQQTHGTRFRCAPTPCRPTGDGRQDLGGRLSRPTGLARRPRLLDASAAATG